MRPLRNSIATLTPSASRAYAAIAGGLAVISIVEIAASNATLERSALLAAASLCMTIPLAFVRARPVAVTLLVLAAFLLEEAFDGALSEALAPFLALVVVMYAGSAHARHVGAAVIALASLAVVVGSVALFDEGGADAASLTYAAIVVAAAVGAGRIVAGRSNRIDELEQDRARVLRDQHARAEAAAGAERMRIARELHDVVTHRVSAMVLQASAERRARSQSVQTAPDDPVDEVLASIEGLGRDALAELRHLLGALHRDGGADARTPQPSIEQLADLVDQAGRASLTTRLDVTGTPRDVPAGVSLSVYRIVQESLTNAMRYASGGIVDVELEYTDTDVLVTTPTWSAHRFPVRTQQRRKPSRD